MQLVVNAGVAVAIAHVLLGQIVLRLPLLCHVMSVCRQSCNFVFGCAGAYHEGLGSKWQTGTKDSPA